MFKKSYFFRWLFSVLLVVSIITANVSVAFADDGVTPEPTSTAQPTEEGTAPAATETPAPEFPPTSDGVEETATPETTPDVIESPSDEEQVPAEDEAPDAPLFEQIPEDTEVVVLDENGEAIPLASEEALNTILDTDPMWCPAGVMPGGPGCSQNFATISALLTSMRNNTGNYTQNGIIYFTANTGASFTLTTAGSSLGSSDFNALNDFNLTLQGGWNGLTGAGAVISGQTSFGSNTLTIGTSSNPWAGNITINDFTFNNVSSGSAITVYTTSGDITLDNVTVSQQGGDNNTAYIDSQSGDIIVQNSSFDGNNSGSNRNQGFHGETNTGAITVSDTTFRDARDCTFFIFFCLIDATENSNGATLSAPTVTLTNVTAFNNDLSGIEINNANSVWLNNVVSYNNGTFVLIVGLGSGVHVNGNGSTVVNVTGGTLSDNEAYGLSVFSGSISATTDPTCSNNRYPGPHPSQCYNTLPLDTTPPVLNLPANMTVEATGSTGAAATFSPTATDAVDGPVAVSCTPASGSVFPIGVTTVNCSASDASSNTANGSFNITVQDTTPPVLSLPANITTEATGASGASVTFSASSADLVDGSLSVVCSPASGSIFPIGLTSVNCSVTDSHSNTSSGSFNVTVQDTTAPILTLPSDITDEASGPAGASITFSASGTDLVDGSISASCTPASGSTFPIGTTTVNCSVTDSHNNTVSGNFDVKIEDTTAPVISPIVDIVNKTSSASGTVVTYSSPATSDLVDGAGVATCTPASGSFFPIGTTTVTCTAQDSHGNTATPFTFLVTLKFSGIQTLTNSNGFLITVTGGELLDLDCFTIVNAFGIKVTFHNLCEHQAVITEMKANTLPEKLPDGFAFIKGLNVTVLFDNGVVEELPHASGVQLDYPISANGHDQYAVLLWDNMNKEWLDVTQLMKDDELAKMLSTDAENELYQIAPTETTKALYRILSTEKTGTFVIVKK